MSRRRPPIYGPELWEERGGASWSHWDLWFCLVCATETGGDWDALEEEIIARARLRSVTSQTWERKRSHLLDLRTRLQAGQVTAADLASDALDDKALRTKARRKVLDQGLAGRDLTSAMEDTPRRRLRDRAYRGHWPQFPMSPAEGYELFAAIVEGERRSFHLAMELEEVATAEHERRVGEPAGQLALWRGLLTAGLEAFYKGLRDSDGAVGTYLGEALETYAALAWRDTGIDPVTYWSDLCEWCIWEDWGIRYQRGTTPFRGARKHDVELVEGILADLEAEHRRHRLDYQADEARQLVAWLAVATQSFDRFVLTAERLGADWWLLVDAMGEAAVDAGKADLAAEVYGAAVAGGGWHVDHLTLRCRERTGRDPTPRRRLRAVE
ncbi:MAG TPA: hypothetical protein VGV93_12070 [Acidimicrobiales bacterium]|nr:hypothetical protein [Acidimicrobiales bacterium]